MSNARFGLRVRNGLVRGITEGLTASDADALAFINAANITDNTQQNAIIQLVVNLKTFGLWTKTKAIYPFVGGNASAHKFNLKDPRDLDIAFRLIFNGGWTHSNTGALPNGTNALANTHYNPTTLSQSLISSHLTYYQRGLSSGTSAKIGAGGISIDNAFCIGFFSSGTVEVGTVGSLNFNQYAPSGTSPASQGLFMINTNGNRNAQHWINGNKNGLTVLQTGNMPNFNITIAALNGSAAPYFHNRECAFASIGDGLTDTEAANFYTAVQAFQTTLGRQV